MFLGTINRIDNSAFRWHNWYRYTNFHVGSLHLCNNQWISLSFTPPSKSLVLNTFGLVGLKTISCFGDHFALGK